jgi:hypothetical protein
MKTLRNIFVALLGFLLFGCRPDSPETLFTKLSETETGITFRNLLKEDNPDFNILTYPYFYNGAGVAVGDINNDGLTDIFFTGNMVKNRLFLNKGSLDFEDITTQSHVAEKEGWCTGATMIDINQDGWLDIYVCRAGLQNPVFRKNLLFINNHDLSFTEQANQYGLDDAGHSTQASFFDYDRDNDLDMMLINQSLPEYAKGEIDYLQSRDRTLDSTFRNKLFRNDKGHFTDVSAAAGIHSTVMTFSLGLSTSDLNMDGWPDIYIANDFKEPDHYYVNNGNGTFTTKATTAFDHHSLYSMGVDAGDFNNDLLPDLVVLDMLAESNKVQKMHLGGDNYTQYKYLFSQGMFYQYMKNCLQKNNGDGTFSEIGQFAGISNTDWSWSPLLADFDNDGLKDLFVSNGYKRDNTEVEFIMYSMNESIRIQKGGPALNVKEYISHMPGISLPNYIFRNTGNDQFENKIKSWGLDHNTFSHGAAYVDLDNDGDLDLITNNTDDYAGVYRNNSETFSGNNFLKIKLNGANDQDFGIGAKIFIYSASGAMLLEQNPSRGFQSSSDPVLHAGLGKVKLVDSLRVVWPDQQTQILKNINANQVVTLHKRDATLFYNTPKNPKSIFTPDSLAVSFHHNENDYNDFLKQFLLPNDYSHHGPCMAAADVNHDGLEDLFVGGAVGQPSQILIQNRNGIVTNLKNPAFEADRNFENMSAVFFDADGDHDPDLYVASGGYSQSENSPLLQDRLYVNNGAGKFTRSQNQLPEDLTSKNCIAPADIDGDGDLDLFVGGHVKSGKYPIAEQSRILINNGKGIFSVLNDETKLIAELGIVNGAGWTDINNDGRKDLVVAAEWRPLQAFINTAHGFEPADSSMFAAAGAGLWGSLLIRDLDGDGDDDIVAGNYGLNSQFKVDTHHPLKMYYADFDQNGSVDPVITHYIGEKAYPLVPRDDINGQMPILKKKFNDYRAYADATIDNMLNKEQLSRTQTSIVNNLATVYLENTGHGYKMHALTHEAQLSTVSTIVAGDFNRDGFDDLIMAGNQSYNRIYLGRHDASHGTLLLGDGKGNLKYASQSRSGLNLKGDTKSGVVMKDKIVFGINGGSAKAYRY